MTMDWFWTLMSWWAAGNLGLLLITVTARTFGGAWCRMVRRWELEDAEHRSRMERLRQEASSDLEVLRAAQAEAARFLKEV